MRRIVSLSVGVALLTFGLYLQPTTATAGGGGPSGCFEYSTCAAANDADGALEFPAGPNSPSDCPVLCAKWVANCKSLVNTIATCLKNSVQKQSSVYSSVCKTYPNPGQQICLGQVEDYEDSCAVQIAGEKSAGKNECESESTVFDCLAACGGM